MKRANFMQAQNVEVSSGQDKIALTPIDEPEFLLDELLDQVTAGNLHREIDTGNSVGKELC
jgi:antitoxin component of MazEF toxin-antitoxin module